MIHKKAMDGFVVPKKKKVGQLGTVAGGDPYQASIDFGDYLDCMGVGFTFKGIACESDKWGLPKEQTH